MRPFTLVSGVPLELVRAADRGDRSRSAWRVPIHLVTFSSSEGDRLVHLDRAPDYVAAIARVAELFGPELGDPEMYPLASAPVLALVADLKSATLRALCLSLESSFTVRWPEDLADALYLADVSEAFPGEPFVVGWEATGPMVDFAFAFLRGR